MIAPVNVLAPAQPDAVLASAVEAARAAVLETAPEDHVGEHEEVRPEGEHAVTHFFRCTHPGYGGWRWAVTVSRAPGTEDVTVDEAVLLPGPDSLVAPGWVPYQERLQPGDLSPGDLLPVPDDDPRLVPTYSFGDDPLDSDEKAQIRQVAGELYLGRVRTLSPEGREMAAQRWYDSDRGPGSPLAQAAPDVCATCGFLVRLSGGLADLFGVCANGNANDDGRVVSLDHGCGAHSEVKLARRQRPLPVPEHVWDTLSEDLEDF